MTLTTSRRLAVQPHPIHHFFLTRPSRASNNESDMADDKDNKGEDGGELAQGNSKQRPTDTMNVDQKPNDALISKVRVCTLP